MGPAEKWGVGRRWGQTESQRQDINGQTVNGPTETETGKGDKMRQQCLTCLK